MPVYNAGVYVREAIESVLSQSFTNFEFIIINDGSTDDSLQVIQSFSDKRIRLIDNKRNQGIIATRNQGLDLANGKYIANMDADDICLPGRFEKQLNFLEKNPDVAILATKLVLVDPSGSEIGIWPEDNGCVSEADIRATLPIINCIGQPTIVMRTSIIRSIGYNKRFKHNEDWGLWLHVLSEGYRIAKLNEVLLKYRQHPKSTTVQANSLGVDKKILSFKFNYLNYKLGSGKFRGTDKKVLSSFARELLRFCIKTVSSRIYGFIARFAKVNKGDFLRQFRQAKRQLNRTGRSGHLYFFPYFHMGGAERVHASILEAAAQPDAVVFITSRSENEAFLQKFVTYATVIEIEELLKLGFSRRWIIKKIQALLPQSQQNVVFGCNSRFFYELIPFLPEGTRIIDLLHAFVHVHESGPEKWSLPYVGKLDTRIVINERTKKDFEAFYEKHKVSSKLLARIKIIPNFAEPSEVLHAKDSREFHVAYVGRGGEEKRVNLIAEVAHRIRKTNKQIHFHFVGKVKQMISPEFYEACIFHNEIVDEDKIRALYKMFHVLVIASTREGFPMVIMEAMMQGAVPVSTNVGGISEHVHHGENGLLINTTVEEEIKNELEKDIKRLAADPNEWRRLSEHAYHYAVEHFSKKKFFTSWYQLLNAGKN